MSAPRAKATVVNVAWVVVVVVVGLWDDWPDPQPARSAAIGSHKIAKMGARFNICSHFLALYRQQLPVQREGG
jgi:hypothetical protein